MTWRTIILIEVLDSFLPRKVVNLELVYSLLLFYRRSEEGGGFSYSLPSFAEFARLTMASEG